MKKYVLALACAAAAVAPFGVAHAASTPLSTNSSAPTILNLGDTGTAALLGIGSASLLTGLTADYYFQLQAPASTLTSYLGDLNLLGPVSSSINGVSGSSLTASTFGSSTSSTFGLSSGTEYELVVSGTPGTSFVANVSAAPEPAAWALMVFGIGAIGIAMRRSRRAALGALITA